jgi:hypothetical protein
MFIRASYPVCTKAVTRNMLKDGNSSVMSNASAAYQVIQLLISIHVQFCWSRLPLIYRCVYDTTITHLSCIHLEKLTAVDMVKYDLWPVLPSKWIRASFRCSDDQSLMYKLFDRLPKTEIWYLYIYMFLIHFSASICVPIYTMGKIIKFVLHSRTSIDLHPIAISNRVLM